MDTREKTTPVPAESGKGYTIDELLSMMEPQYQAYQNTIRECIAGLTGHAAQLAAQGREEQLPMFRRIIVEMAAFWGLAEQDTPGAFQDMTDTFDRTVSAAKDSGRAPELSEQNKADILTGLSLYAQEMENSGDMEQWIAECDTLAAQLRTKWEMEAPQENTPQHGMTQGMGMTV